MTTVRLHVRTSKGTVPVTALLAATQEEQERGYLRRQPPASDGEGILFVFAPPKRQTFHMKGVKFPLDIIMADKRGMVVAAANMTPNSPARYAAQVPIRYALEVKGGWVARHGQPISIAEV